MESGWNVTSIDRVPHPDSRVWSTIVDLLDSGSVMDLMTGANERHSKLDAVVHLAAIPAPGLQSDKATINNNLNSTLNVFMAARNAGIKKVVFASSETVLGLPFDTPPPYVPVDEEYEPRPESFYSLSKVLEERLAKELCRWDHELSMVGLRFSNVIDPIEYPSFEDFQDDAIKRKWNLWGYIDARDGALAVEKALDYETPGFEPFIIASPDSVMRMTNTQLLQEVFPEVALRRQVSEHETLLGIEKAKRLLGFNPSNSWRDL
jgi:nucleoside-diphosphate-sugar epimerase